MVGLSDRNNDRYSWWPVCCGNATVAQLTLDWDLGYSLISLRDTPSAIYCFMTSLNVLFLRVTRDFILDAPESLCFPVAF